MDMDSSSRSKTRKDITEYNTTINQLDIIDIYSISSNNSRIHILLTHIGTFTKIDHILGHKTHYNKFKGTEIIQCLFSDHNGIKLEIQ